MRWASAASSRWSASAPSPASEPSSWRRAAASASASGSSRATGARAGRWAVSSAPSSSPGARNRSAGSASIRSASRTSRLRWVAASSARIDSTSSPKKSSRTGVSAPHGQTSTTPPRAANSPCASTAPARAYPDRARCSRSVLRARSSPGRSTSRAAASTDGVGTSWSRAASGATTTRGAPGASSGATGERLEHVHALRKHVGVGRRAAAVARPRRKRQGRRRKEGVEVDAYGVDVLRIRDHGEEDALPTGEPREHDTRPPRRGAPRPGHTAPARGGPRGPAPRFRGRALCSDERSCQGLGTRAPVARDVAPAGATTRGPRRRGRP